MIEIIGYLHIVVEKITLLHKRDNISCEVSLSEESKARTFQKSSDQTWNQPFMFEVSNEHKRLKSVCYQGDEKIGQNRYDIQPFFAQSTNSYCIDGELVDENNSNIGSIKIKVTFYSNKHGKLRLRVFHLSMLKPYAERFKEAKLKVKGGHHAKISRAFNLSEQFDESFDIIVLSPSMSLAFEVIHDEGMLGSFSINNIEKANLLIDQPKAYQVSLFGSDKAVGMIKYQVDWVKNK